MSEASRSTSARRSLGVVVALTACGCGDSIEIPAAPDEAARVEVTTYTLHDPGIVDQGAIAVFRDPDGTTVREAKVDKDGRATAYLPRGGMVMVLQSGSPTLHVTVVRGVEPGDRVAIGVTQRTGIQKRGAVETMQASYTSIGPAEPQLLIACGDSDAGNPRTIRIYADCATSTFGLLAVADEQGSDVRRFVWQDRTPYVAGGAFEIPDAWQVMPRNTTTFADEGDGFALLYVAFDGALFELDRQTVGPGVDSVGLRYAPIDKPTIVLASKHLGDSLHSYATFTHSPQSVSIDPTSLPLPQVQNLRQTATGASWSEIGTGAGDARVVTWNTIWHDGDGIMHSLSYELFEDPASGSSTELPPLPSAYASEEPSRNAARLTGITVSYLNYDNVNGYAEARTYGPNLARVGDYFRETEHRAHMLFQSIYPPPKPTE